MNANSSPEMINYLTYLFDSRHPPPCLGQLPLNAYYEIRSAAMINLKNTIWRSSKQISEDTKSYIRTAALRGLDDPNVALRNLSGTLITQLIDVWGFASWPQLIPELMASIGNDTGKASPEVQQAAMSAMLKICDDHAKTFNKGLQGQRPLDAIMPKLLDFSDHSISTVRYQALSAVKNFLTAIPNSLQSMLDTIIGRVFQHANDESPEVRRKVCQVLVQIVDLAPEKIAPHMDGLIEYVIMQQKAGIGESYSDAALNALDAAEFWLSVGEHSDLRDGLGPHLQQIIPVLLDSMVYNEEDARQLEGDDEDDAEEEDSAQDLKPRFAKSRSTRTKKYSAANGDGQSAHLAGADDLSDGEIEEDLLVEDEDDGFDPEDDWNLRKCSAAALDVIATVFHQPVFGIVLPYLKENLRHSEWPRREASVLALGAIADGCMDTVKPHLPELIPYLISLLDDEQPVVRQITCWALGRYSGWASHLKSQEQTQQFFVPMMEGLLNRMLDNTKRVQEAAASAFANLEEKAGAQLTPYCLPIVRQFSQCFEKYKDKNMYILYDCVQTLAASVGSKLAEPELLETTMSTLFGRWNKIPDDSREIFPLLECMGYVVTALGDVFSRFAPTVFGRCTRIIFQNLTEHLRAVNNEAITEPDKDFLVTALDLVSAMVQALDPAKSIELMQSSEPKFFELLAVCLQDPSNDTRQSAYALLGDCAIKIYTPVHPYLPQIIPLIDAQLDLDKIFLEEPASLFGVLNNACWSTGEIALQAKSDMAPYIGVLYKRMFDILSNPEAGDSVNENAAIALGRLGSACPAELAPRLGEFAVVFLIGMAGVDDNEEKRSALLGFNQCVQANPQAMEGCLLEYLGLAATYPKEGPEREELRASFQQVSYPHPVSHPHSQFYPSFFHSGHNT